MKKMSVSELISRIHLRDFRFNVLIVILLAIFTLAPNLNAVAQEESKEKTDAFTLEEITVTGSRIRGTTNPGATVVGLNREDINISAGVTVDRVIKELPQVFDLGVSESSRGQSGGAGNIVYSNSINLHGIGPYATLILIDGHRVVNNTRSTDPSVIPTLGLDRIEVVADGASAVYGSDAVAGVVNSMAASIPPKFSRVSPS